MLRDLNSHFDQIWQVSIKAMEAVGVVACFEHLEYFIKQLQVLEELNR